MSEIKLGKSDAALYTEDGAYRIAIPNDDPTKEVPPHVAFIVAVGLKAMRDPAWVKAIIDEMLVEIKDESPEEGTTH